MKTIKRVNFCAEESSAYINKVRLLNQGALKKYFIETYGCQMNVHDSEKIAGMLTQMGYTACTDRQAADFILFNTCCVRENAELRVYGNVGALKALKAEKPSLRLAICGCMMQQPEVVQKIKDTFGFVDIVFGSHNTHVLPRLLHDSIVSNKPKYELLCDAQEIVEEVPVVRERSFSAWVTVMYGCDNYCSYCIVPYVRGRERSRRSADIIKEVQALAEDGCKEITLLGQNVNSYGKDCGEISFAELLRDLDTIAGIERIGFMTSHPKDCSDALLDAIAQCKHVSKHLHLPVQSGSDAILTRMNRKYTRQSYLELVQKAKTKIPGVAITTDLIVGFPGETEEDFLATMDLYRQAEFASAYTFIYSKRNGTPAAEMPNQITAQVKKERLARLIALGGEYTKKLHEGYVGHTYPVLVEAVSKRSNRMVSGKTHCGRMVSFAGDKSLIGSIVKVNILEAKANTLSGILVREEN